MKHGKTPTRKQKERLTKLNLDPYGWLVVRDDENCFQVIHRVSGAIRWLWK